ncbi:unnamed protein product [Paramecium primaurelia]|uniref:Uncharacterized protein n=1 Tax=Paramecium primaurelia TaxID=5886 RepID=A0A8S1KS31_PARPR|nr:unnamed protein product [Paramecium primaurelia]
MSSASPVHQQLQKTLDVVQRGFEEIVQNIPKQYHELCMNQNAKNMEKYAQCMYKKSKTVDKQMKAFDFKMLFMGITFDQCIQTNSQDQCIKNAKSSVEGFISDFQKNVK